MSRRTAVIIELATFATFWAVMCWMHVMEPKWERAAFEEGWAQGGM